MGGAAVGESSDDRQPDVCGGVAGNARAGESGGWQAGEYSAGIHRTNGLGPNLAPGSTFTLLNKTSTGLITGTFTGKANNSTFTDDGCTFRINYTLGDGNDNVLTLLTTPIEQWRFTHYGSVLNTGTALDTADTDGDAVSNLLEYATKMNPAANDVVPQSATKNGSNLEYLYTKNKAATDVTLTVEWSDDFTTWSATGVIQALIPGSDNGVTQQWKATMPAGVNGRRFVRLRVTR